MRWVVAADHAGFILKDALEQHLLDRGDEVDDLGTHTAESTDYPDRAHAVAEEITSGRAERGLLVCGTGVGISIACNRHPGVRAALCTNEFMAAMARSHNDANVLCLGSRVVGPGLAAAIVDAFRVGVFEGGRHAARVAKIDR